ncbi:OsmC family protein [Proteiniphilum acetatigenes]|uniref:OsmC family protein n=1 Tax=Proteiniphilum acetatigenes TaxID=294710 RepID=UPI00036E83CC|nr:OsmC family protein [Proteiniphilum acetatigenes]SFK31593.1 putative redox protein [Porphyromonadaceae bacterium KH3CP3RA]
MVTHSIQTVWRENNIFDTEIDGHKVTIDLAEEAGGNDAGPRPKRLLLIAAAGCTGLDVMEIVRKMRIDLKGFDIRMEAEMAEEHPKQYTSLKVIYEFEGDNLPEEKLERACKLSFDNYCGVLAMYKKAIPVTYEVIIKNS